MPSRRQRGCPGLLGYEQRIAFVPESPLDAAQIARFGFIVLIGLGSWLGGAVVEHLLDTSGDEGEERSGR